MPGGHQEFLDGPQTADHVRSVFAPVRGGELRLAKARKWALDSTFLLILLQTAPKDLCYSDVQGQYVSGCEIMELSRMGG